MTEVNNKKEMSTGDLAYLVITKILWFGLAVGIAVLTYQKTAGFFFETLKFSSNFWLYVSGLVSFGAGTVFNWVYDGAFD